MTIAANHVTARKVQKLAVQPAMDAPLPLSGPASPYDNALMGILQDCAKLPVFLDAVFSFLARRTDFYILLTSEQTKMGFPQGVAEGMVLQVCMLGDTVHTGVLVDRL